MQRVTLAISVILIFILGTWKENNEYETALNKLFGVNSISYNNTTKVILFVPIDGCSSCVREAVNYSKKHLKNNHFQLILVSRYRNSIESNYTSD